MPEGLGWQEPSHLLYVPARFWEKHLDTCFTVKRTNFGIKQTSTKISSLSLTNLDKSCHLCEHCFLSFRDNTKLTSQSCRKDKMNRCLWQHLGQGFIQNQCLGELRVWSIEFQSWCIKEGLQGGPVDEDVGLCVN